MGFEASSTDGGVFSSAASFPAGSVLTEASAVTARYALYYAPPRESALWRFGCALLGHDAESGLIGAPALAGVEPGLWQELARKPGHYGFHGTLKAPFRLASGHDEMALEAAVAAFAASCPAFDLPALELRSLSDFFALVPAVPVPDLCLLARRAVLELDDFRAPLTEADRARRNPHRLSPRQRVLLEAHGYPFVLEEFRFHITLTGPVAALQQAAVHQALAAAYAESGACAPLRLSDVALFMQPSAQERFRLVRRFPLGHAADTMA